MEATFLRDLAAFVSGVDKQSDALAKLSVLVRKCEHKLHQADYVMPAAASVWAQQLSAECRGDQAFERLDNVQSEQFIDKFNDSTEQKIFRLKKILVANNVMKLQIRRDILFDHYFLKMLTTGIFLSTPAAESELRNVYIENCELKRVDKSTPLSLLRCNQIALLAARLFRLQGHTVLSKKTGNSNVTIVKIGCSDEKWLARRRQDDGQDSLLVPVHVGPVFDTELCRKHDSPSVVYQRLVDDYALSGQDRDTAGLASLAQRRRHLRALASADLQFQLVSTAALKKPCELSPAHGRKICSVLYNFVRLSHIFRAFEEDKRYPALPPPDRVQFALLKEDEEWELLFVYILPYEDLLRETVSLERRAALPVHKLCKFLVALSATVSRYYNRVRVLKDPVQPQILETVFARIYLLKLVRDVIRHALQVLDIEPVFNM